MEIAEIHCGARIVTISTQGASTYIGVVPSRVRSYVSRRFVDAGAVVWLRWMQRGGHGQSGQSVDSSAGSATIESSGTDHHSGALQSFSLERVTTADSRSVSNERHQVCYSLHGRSPLSHGHSEVRLAPRQLHKSPGTDWRQVGEAEPATARPGCV